MKNFHFRARLHEIRSEAKPVRDKISLRCDVLHCQRIGAFCRVSTLKKKTGLSAWNIVLLGWFRIKYDGSVS